MTRLNARKFSSPDWLAMISPQRLTAFLSRWAPYLRSRGFTLPAAAEDSFDYSALSAVLMSPAATTPADLIDALYHVHETSTPEDMDALSAAAEASGICIPDSPAATPADLAVAIWNADADLVRDRHAETTARRQQQVTYFAGKHAEKRPFPPMDVAKRTVIEADLNEWFLSHRRGSGCRLSVFRQTPMVWLLIRHGQPMRREASQNDAGETDAEFYRPQHHDVLVYDERYGELGVHAGTKGERELYLSTVGKHLFDDSDHFPTAKKFTLSPLITDGFRALTCADVDGVEAVKLVEYQCFWGGQHKETEIRRSTDVFAALQARGREAQLPAVPSAAVFMFTFSDAPKARRVVIRPPAVARYERNEDSERVEHWLRARQFMTSQLAGDDDDAATATAVLEGAA